MKLYLQELVVLLAVFGGIPFQVMTDSPAYANPTNPPLRVTGGIQVGTCPGGVCADSSSYVTAYGADQTGVADSTAAIQSAVTATEASRSGTVYFPCGKYLVSGTITMHKGTTLAGCSGSANNDAFGTSIEHASNGNLFVWDGNSTTSAAGVGGGLRDMFIEKEIGFSGGDAIYLVSTDDNHRPGEMVFRNIVVSGQNNSAIWSRGFHLDGTASNTVGGRGVRSIYLDKVRFAACDDINFPSQCVYLNQPTHVFAPYLQIDPVGGSSAGMTVAGNFDDVFLYGLEINGTLVISQPPDNTYNPHMLLMGHVGTSITNNATTLVGRAVVTTASITNASASFDIINPGTASSTSGSWFNTGLTTVKGTAYPAGNLFVVQDNIGDQNLTVTDNGAVTIKPGAADSSTAVGLDINTVLSWVTAGAKLIRARIAGGSDVFSVGLDGAITGKSATVSVGTGTATGKVWAELFRDTTVTNSVTTGETAGSTYTLPANTLSSNGQMIVCRAAWVHAANTNSTTAKMYVNGVALVTITNASSSDVIETELRLVRTSSSTATFGGYTLNNGGGFTGHRGTMTIAAGSNMDIHISVTGSVANGDLATNFLRCDGSPG